MPSKSLRDAINHAVLSEDPVFPGDPAYDDRRKVWNGAIDRRPAAIIRAHSVADIRAAIALAGDYALPLAVRGGGHSIPGFSTCDDGIVLDLSQMNRVQVDPQARRVEAQGGALLGQLDASGEPHNLVVPAGVISHTGVAGLTLGGGMGWLSRRFGMTVDSLESVRMVLADGSVIEASAEAEPDLFWALRGGGGNFGVVTDFRFRMHSIGPVVNGVWHWPLSAAAGLLTELAELARSAPRWITSSFVISRAGVDLTAFATGPEASAAAISPYGALAGGGEAGATNLSFVDFQRRNDENDGWGLRVYARGGFFADLDSAAIETMLLAVSTAKNDNAGIYVIQLGGAVGDIDEDATAYSGRDAGYYWISSPAWTDPASDAANMAWGRQTGQRLAAIAAEGNYVNEQSDTSVELVRSAYGRKYERLAAIKARFDPGNLFRLNQNIKPAP